MTEFFQAGGFPMWFVLAFGLIALLAAVLFAIRPDLKRIGAIKALSAATMFAVGSGVAAGFAMVMTNVPNIPEYANDPKVHFIVMIGLGECMSLPVLGFSLLALVSLVTAVGYRRLARVS